MWDSLGRGYKLALVTLAVEAIAALFVVSDTLGLFAIFAIPLIGTAWLPASLAILSDLRQERRPGTIGYLIAAACGIAGIACIGVWFKWIVLAAFVR